MSTTAEPQTAVAAPSQAPAETKFQGHLRFCKLALEDAKDALTEHEWHTLRAILLIQLRSEDGE